MKVQRGTVCWCMLQDTTAYSNTQVAQAQVHVKSNNHWGWAPTTHSKSPPEPSHTFQSRMSRRPHRPRQQSPPPPHTQHTEKPHTGHTYSTKSSTQRHVHISLARHRPQQSSCISDRAERVRQKQHSTREAGERPNTSKKAQGQGNGRTIMAVARKQSNLAQRQEQTRHAPPQRHTPKWRVCTEAQWKHRALPYTVIHYSVQRHPGRPSPEAHRKRQSPRGETHPPCHSKPTMTPQLHDTKATGTQATTREGSTAQTVRPTAVNQDDEWNSRATTTVANATTPPKQNDTRKAAHGCNPACRKQSHLAPAQRPGKGKALRERRRSTTAVGSHTKTGW